jgi:hypothetical protein
MLQDLAALTPPAIVCAAVLIGAWAIVRRELAPKRKDRAEPAATADEEPAADHEHGRSLYFTTSEIYLHSSFGYAVSRLPEKRRHPILFIRADCHDDNVRVGDMLTVHLLSRDVARKLRLACGFARCYSLHQEVPGPRNCVGHVLGICYCDNTYSAEGLNLHGAEGAGTTAR